MKQILPKLKEVNKYLSFSSKEEKDQSSLNRFLTESDWNEDDVQDRYVKKISHQTRGKPISLLIDDSISKKTGKQIEEAQYHKDHAGNGYVFGHQIVTALIICMGLLLPLFPKLYSK